jgi:type I restriction enzyme, S subunit
MKERLMKLREFCDLQNGFAFKSDDYVEISNTISCRMSNIRPNASFDILYNPKYLPDSYATKYKDFLLQDGDVIVAMTDMATDPKILGVPTIVETRGFNVLLNQRVGKICKIDSTVINLEYLKRVLSRPELKSYYKKFSGGGIQLNISRDSILNITIPVPTIEKQVRIANILRKAEALILQRKESLRLLDESLNSRFLDMFGDLARNSREWDSKLLGKICDVGSSKRVFVEELVSDGIPFYRGTEIGQLAEGAEIEPSLFITESHYDQLRAFTGIPKVGDLLLPSICPDGRIFRVVTNKPFYFKDGRVLWIKVNDQEINSIFLQYALKAIFKSNYKNIASGTTFAELKIVALKQIILPTPPSALQFEFSRIVQKIEILKEQFHSSLKELEDLYASLSQRAFNGELT